MARVIIAGAPGDTYTNTTGKVAYQFLCDWKNTCGQCAQYDHQVGPTWPIPLHRGCKCRQIAIWPGETSRPFADFRAEIASLPDDRKAKVVGVANLKLIEAGKVEWEDVVTGQRVRDLREVVATKKLSVDAMTSAGVARSTAERAYRAVHTPAHELAAQKRAELVGKILGKGTQEDALRAALAEKLAARVGIAAGPSGSTSPPAVPTPAPATAPKARAKPKPLPVSVPVTASERADYLLKAKVKPDVAEQAALLEESEAQAGVKYTAGYHDQGAPFVVVDVAALDAALARIPSSHVGPGGAGPSAKPGAYERFVEFLEKARAGGIAVEMPRLTLDAEGRPELGDGRHRFAVFRDQGVTLLPVTVRKAAFADVRDRFGSRPARGS